jgi:hypothetical protein
MIEEFCDSIWNDTTQLFCGIWLLVVVLPITFLYLLEGLVHLLNGEWFLSIKKVVLGLFKGIAIFLSYFLILTALYLFGQILFALFVIFALAILGECLNPFPNKQNNK